MSLVLKSNPTINPAGNEFYIEFVDATGVYDAETNPGGFGGSNPSRNQLAILFYGVHKMTEEDIIANPLSYNPLSSSSITLSIYKAINGVLQYYLFAVLIFDEEADYEDDDVVYDNTTNPSSPIIKRMVDGDWVTILVVDIIDDENVVQLENNVFPIPDVIEFKNQLNAQRTVLLEEKLDGKCSEDLEKVRDRFDAVEAWLQTAIDDFCAGAYTEAQEKVDAIFDLKDKIEDE